ncbi:MAG TPA: hypothetical protein VF435_01710 [Pyrinomonadaceae bacterium]
MKIKYREYADDTRPEGASYYPLLQIFLRYDGNMKQMFALVDSGSVDCVFPGSVGKLLNVDIRSGKPYKIHGFDLQSVPGFVHKVHLQVAGFTHWVAIEAVFSEMDGIPILGQIGFFENYQVVFERWARRFEITTKTDAIARNRRGYGRRR